MERERKKRRRDIELPKNGDHPTEKQKKEKTWHCHICERDLVANRRQHLATLVHRKKVADRFCICPNPLTSRIVSFDARLVKTEFPGKEKKGKPPEKKKDICADCGFHFYINIDDFQALHKKFVSEVETRFVFFPLALLFKQSFFFHHTQ